MTSARGGAPPTPTALAFAAGDPLVEAAIKEMVDLTNSVLTGGAVGRIREMREANPTLFARPEIFLAAHACVATEDSNDLPLRRLTVAAFSRVLPAAGCWRDTGCLSNCGSRCTISLPRRR